MTPAMRFSIVIATYKRANLLKDTLESLARLCPSGPWEVIVVDNNSPDDTREVVESMLAQQDSWSLSNFEGYPSQVLPIDWTYDGFA